MSIKIYLDEVKRSQFKAICALENLSMNEVLLELLENWLEKHTLPTTGDRPQPQPPTASKANGKGRGKSKQPQTTKPKASP